MQCAVPEIQAVVLFLSGQLLHLPNVERDRNGCGCTKCIPFHMSSQLLVLVLSKSDVFNVCPSDNSSSILKLSLTCVASVSVNIPTHSRHVFRQLSSPTPLLPVPHCLFPGSISRFGLVTQFSLLCCP